REPARPASGEASDRAPTAATTSAPSASASRRGQLVAARRSKIALAGRQQDLLLLDEIEDLDLALLDREEAAVAAVGREPVGAADGRRAVLRLRPEVAGALPPQVPHDLLLRL